MKRTRITVKLWVLVFGLLLLAGLVAALETTANAEQAITQRDTHITTTVTTTKVTAEPVVAE
ncbi:hypothetical protein [Weissella cibaria]|uniref:hypothetical protein n=1 Tax=Weissella cibaria TaxID=137591 RepID=UPI001FD6F0E2|nr:hypothetical protein [Weissella cibaria]